MGGTKAHHSGGLVAGREAFQRFPLLGQKIHGRYGGNATEHQDLKEVAEFIKKGKSHLTYPYTEALRYFEQALDYYKRRIATDAWSLYQHSDAQEHLETALQFAERGVQFATEPRY